MTSSVVIVRMNSCFKNVLSTVLTNKNKGPKKEESQISEQSKDGINHELRPIQAGKCVYILGKLRTVHWVLM